MARMTRGRAAWVVIALALGGSTAWGQVGKSHAPLSLDPLLYVETAEGRRGPAFFGVVIDHSLNEAVTDALGEPTGRRGDTDLWQDTPLLRQLGIKEVGVNYGQGGVPLEIGIRLVRSITPAEAVRTLGLESAPRRLRKGESIFYSYLAEGIQLGTSRDRVVVLRLRPPETRPPRPQGPHVLRPERALRVPSVKGEFGSTLVLRATVRPQGFRAGTLTVTFTLKDPRGQPIRVHAPWREKFADERGIFRTTWSKTIARGATPRAEVTVPLKALWFRAPVDRLNLTARAECGGLTAGNASEFAFPTEGSAKVLRGLRIVGLEQRHDETAGGCRGIRVRARVIGTLPPPQLGRFHVWLRTQDGRHVRATTGAPPDHVDAEGRFVVLDRTMRWDAEREKSDLSAWIPYAALDLAEGREHRLVLIFRAESRGVGSGVQEECLVRIPRWPNGRPSVPDGRLDEILARAEGFVDALAAGRLEQARGYCTGKMSDAVSDLKLRGPGPETRPRCRGWAATIDGERATARVWIKSPSMPDVLSEYMVTLHLVRSDGDWKIVSLKGISPHLPDREETGAPR